jgi:pSer/pThr/pTyr-binding forkhead associated (FHA) protein
MLTCPWCGEVSADGSPTCERCGAALASVGRGPVCAQCNTPNPPGTNFCHTCGAPLPAARPVDPTPAPATEPQIPVAEPQGARLVTVRRDGSDGEAFPIVGSQMDIGRSDGDLRFDDPHLAARHARILRQADQFIVTPLEARNGVYRRIEEATELLDGEQFLVGKQVLRYEQIAEAETALRPAIEHGVVLFGTPVKTPWGRLRQMTSAGTSRDLYHLTRGEVTLGREQGDIVFSEDEFLSRRHAQLQVRGGRVTLQDLGSSNGTYVRLRGQHALGNGEMLRMGDELLRFELG